MGDVLQDTFEGADPSPAHVEAAILGQNEWLRKATKRHFYDSEYAPDGSPPVTLPTEPLSVSEEVCDVPESPHPQHSQLVHHEERRYPKTRRGRYARVRLDRRDVSTITGLEVRTQREYEDWFADATKTEGRSGAYYLQTDPHTGLSSVYVDVVGMAPLADWQESVVISYDYGDDAMPDTIRRAVAHRAAAELITDDDANIQIPDSGALMSVKTKADEFRQTANSLLKPYRASPMA